MVGMHTTHAIKTHALIERRITAGALWLSVVRAATALQALEAAKAPPVVLELARATYASRRQGFLDFGAVPCRGRSTRSLKLGLQPVARAA
jgi:hypothetical protein